MIRLNWTPVNNANSTGQKIMYSIDGGAYQELASVAKDVATYDFAATQVNTHYSFKIVNLCSSGSTADSNIVIEEEFACPVITISPSADGLSAIVEIADPGGTIDNFTTELYLNSDGSGTGGSHGSTDFIDNGEVTEENLTQGAPGSGTPTTINLTGLTPNSNYAFIVNLNDNALTHKCQQNFNTTVAVCEAPSNLTALIV